MFKKFLIALAMCASLSAFSATIDTSGMTDAQVAALKASAAKAIADNASATANEKAGSQPTEILSLATTWGTQASTAAEGFAKAINVAARELGVTVNEFIKTDAGKLTAALIVWKVAGSAIANLLFGIITFIVGMLIARAFHVRLFTRGFEKVEYSYFGGLFKGAKRVRIPKSFNDFSSEGEWLVFWVIIGIITFTLLISGAFIT